MQGIIKWFNNSKGYGFIGREGGPDVFLHYLGIIGEGYRTLNDGDRVEFEIVQESGDKILVGPLGFEPRTNGL